MSCGPAGEAAGQLPLHNAPNTVPASPGSSMVGSLMGKHWTATTIKPQWLWSNVPGAG